MHNQINTSKYVVQGIHGLSLGSVVKRKAANAVGRSGTLAHDTNGDPLAPACPKHHGVGIEREKISHSGEDASNTATAILESAVP
jgi:hypothetical protein